MVILLNLNWRHSKEIGRMSKYSPLMPIELFYISEQLKKLNISPELIDLWVKSKKIKSIKNKIKEERIILLNSAPAYLFWRDGTTGIKLIKDSINYIKKINPNTQLILIGPHGTITPELFKDCIIIKGEPEIKAVETIKSLQENKTFKIEEINEIKNLDDLTISYDKLDKKYKRILYETSRGCPFNCTFCFKEGFRNKFRLKSINRIKEDIKKIENAGIKEIYLIDECFGFNKSWAKQVIDEFKKYNIIWSFETRPELLSKEFIDSISETKCNKVEIGLESANKKVLKKMNKSTINLFNLKENVLYLIEKKITPHFFLIVGSEDESKESLKDTLDYIKQFPQGKIICTAGISIPYPKTKLWQNGINEGKNLIPWKNTINFEGIINNPFDKLSIQKEFILFSLKLKKLKDKNSVKGILESILISLFSILPKQIFYRRILFNSIRRLYHLI